MRFSKGTEWKREALAKAIADKLASATLTTKHPFELYQIRATSEELKQLIAEAIDNF